MFGEYIPVIIFVGGVFLILKLFANWVLNSVK